MRGGNVEVIVPNKKWPHEYVLSGSAKERFQYDHLSITQLVAVFWPLVRDEANLETRQHMLDYIIPLMDDANAFPGMRQKPARQCYFVGWSKVRLSIMGKLTKLIGQMLKDMSIHLRVHKIPRKVSNILVDKCHVCILTRTTVLTLKIMKQGVLSTSIFALNASHPLAKFLIIPLLNVETN